MLPGVLLHVVPPPCRIYNSSNALPLLNWLGSEMENSSILFLGCLHNRHFPSVVQNKFSGVVDLSAAGGIKSCAIQHNGASSLALRSFQHPGVEVVEKRIVIVKTISHQIYDL